MVPTSGWKPISFVLVMFTAILRTSASKSSLAGRTGSTVVSSIDGLTALTLDTATASLQSLRLGSLTVPLDSQTSGIHLTLGGVTVAATGPSPVARPLPNGGVAFTASTTAFGNHTAAVQQTFVPGLNGSIEWTLEINGTSPGLWSPSIDVGLRAGSGLNLSEWGLWAPWNAGRCVESLGPALCSGCADASSHFPLQPVPAMCLGAADTYAYGSDVSVPLISLVSPLHDASVSLGLAPTENIINTAHPAVTTDAVGGGRGLGVSFQEGYRVGTSAAPLRLVFNIIGARGCTRDVLGRYSTLHAEVFTPPNHNVHYRASGMGSYAGTQGPLTQEVDGAPLLDTLQSTGYKVNWDATFWWPYIMHIAPTLRPSVPGGYNNATELWGSSFDPVTGYNNRLSRVHVHASYAIRDSYYKNWSDANLTVLGYFNGWEFGQEMNQPYPPNPATCPTEPYDLWRNAPCFIHQKLDAALCRNSDGGFQRGGWDGDTQLDPGKPLYRNFLLQQLQNHLDMEPHFMGVASDGIRACTNWAGDDGVTCGGPATNCVPIQDGFTAWASLMAEVGPLLHSHDKLFSANTVNGPRIHLFRHVDLSITEESAATLETINVNAWIGLGKPVVMWTAGVSTTDGLGPDHFFQRLLHRGLFPMPPMPDGDHSLNNGSAVVHAAFLRYGPLFKALNGRTWVLRPHAVAVRVLGPNATVGGRAGGGLRGERAASGSLKGGSRNSATAGTKISVVPCNATDPSQQWRNATFASGGCPGALQSTQGACLVVFNPKFSPTGCGSGGAGSQIWAYPCPPPTPVAPAPAPTSTSDAAQSAAPRPRPDLSRIHAREVKNGDKGRPVQSDARGGRFGGADAGVAGARDCPEHENIRWELAGSQLRSAVPAGTPGPIDWTLCLDRAPPPWSLGPLELTPCSGQSPGQRWSTADIPGKPGLFQLVSGQDQHCVSSAPFVVPVPSMPPAVNVFEDRAGAQLVVVTSPGQLLNATVEVTLVGVNASRELTAQVVRPGEQALTPLSTVVRRGSDVVATVKLTDGAALLRILL